MSCQPRRAGSANDAHGRARPVRSRQGIAPGREQGCAMGNAALGVLSLPQGAGPCPGMDLCPQAQGARCTSSTLLFPPWRTFPRPGCEVWERSPAEGGCTHTKPPVMVSQGLDLAKGSTGPVASGPFETDCRCYGHRNLSDSSHRLDFTCTSHRCH